LEGKGLFVPEWLVEGLDVNNAQVIHRLRTENGGYAEHFCVGELEIVEASETAVGEARGWSVDKVGALGVLKNLFGKYCAWSSCRRFDTRG
jgi:hypothetical protein